MRDQLVKRLAKRSTLLLFALVAVLYLFTYRGNIDVIDEAMTMGVTAQAADAHTVQINAIYPALLPWGAPDADPTQPIYAKYAPGQSLLALPLYALGKLIPIHAQKTLNDQPYVAYVPFAMALLLNTIATILTVLAILYTVPLWGYSRRTAVYTGILYAATTLAWPYAKTFYSEPTTACALAWMVYFAIRARQHDSQTKYRWNAIAAGLCAGLAILLRTSSAIFIPPLLLYMLPDSLDVLCTLPGIVVGGALTLGYNLLRFGSLSESGYEAGFGRAPWEAWLGFLVSPSRSFFLFNPVLLLALPGAGWLWQRARRDVMFIMSLILAQYALYGAWWAWDGGQSLGPRFLVPAIPLMALFVAPVIERVRWRPVLTGLAIIGFGIQVLCNLANPNDIFFETVNQQGITLEAVNWQLAYSIPATLWTAYSLHDLDSLVLRYVLPRQPVIRALLFTLIMALLVGGMLWLARYLPTEALTLAPSQASAP